MLGGNKLGVRLMSGTALALLMLGSAAAAEPVKFDIAPQSLTAALNEFGVQSNQAVLFTTDLTGAKVTQGVSREAEPEIALAQMLDGTGLAYRRSGEAFLIVRADTPQSGSAAGDGAEVEALIVTAQKREEDIQDVPIAISAFSQRDLEAQKIEGGPDIMRAVPNLTFSKSNFTSYNISIRGIGTKAVSATTDPGVAVSFNNVGMIANRFFEQEFFDMERVEVLRGPQGTLYGRNATGGVVNLITAKPKLGGFEGSIKGEVGNYDSIRLVGMVNVPLVNDVFGIRIAGSMTQRDGYDYNAITKNPINGRELWSLRTTVAFEPTPWFRGNLIWERFEEDDNRSRTGKQLCHRDEGLEMIGSTPVRVENPPDFAANIQGIRNGLFSTGCKPGGLYDDNAFGTPNGLALNAVGGLAFLSDFFSAITVNTPTGRTRFFFIDPNADPYGGTMQSRNLREISSIRDPRYRANSDIVSLNLDFDLSDTLTLSSQTAYSRNEVYSFQDYNRFNTVPIINDTSNTFLNQSNTPSEYRDFAPGGVFCDPQIGCSDTLAIFDISSGEAEQFSQEVRLQSDMDGPFNFSVGGNYTRYEVVDEYYVMSNLFTIISAIQPFNRTGNLTHCMDEGFFGFTLPEPIPIEDGTFCPYIDPNPVESINGEGHNYFRSSNPYDLTSWALFGETYYNINDDLKLTVGLRYTRDKKDFTVIPSQLLLAPNLGAGGFVNKGHPATGEIRQKWGEFTGRIGLDWKPDLSLTDDSLIYAFFSRGYKAGGANPPTPGYATGDQLVEYGVLTAEEVELYEAFGFLPILKLPAVNYAPTFEPEFVNAFEVGAKNTLMGGALTLNLGAFYYDYTGYQVSQIRDRTAVNENFDAEVWGAELTALFAPTDNLRFNANLGYLDSRIKDGEVSIDPMNRTAGNPNFVVTKPWLQLPSNCVVPVHVAEAFLQSGPAFANYWGMCGGLRGGLGSGALPDTELGGFYDPANYPEINDGAGINTDLSGNELPNAPHWTASVGAEYGVDFAGGEWRATVRSDLYWQSQSWSRIYNLGTYDKLHGWWNANLSLWIERPDDDLRIEIYAKNIFDDTPITDAFLNSDDSGLTTNVFVLDPRLIGLSIRKGF